MYVQLSDAGAGCLVPYIDSDVYTQRDDAVGAWYLSHIDVYVQLDDAVAA